MWERYGKREFNTHHLIPSSRWGITSDENTITMKIKEHDRLHAYFQNATPIEQICKVLLVNNKVRTDNFKADLMAVLDNYLNNYYAKKTHSGGMKQEIKNVLAMEDKFLNL